MPFGLDALTRAAGFLMSKESVIESIHNAFSNVTLGDGIGLWQAQAIDDYETSEVQHQKRDEDEKQDWKLFSPGVLQRCHSSLSFFDANGMRFHLPAYMIASLNDEVDDPIFHLTHLDDYAKSKLTTLNREQINAIVGYLKWCLASEDLWPDHEDIQKALNEYWLAKT